MEDSWADIVALDCKGMRLGRLSVNKIAAATNTPPIVAAAAYETILL